MGINVFHMYESRPHKAKMLKVETAIWPSLANHKPQTPTTRGKQPYYNIQPLTYNNVVSAPDSL